MIKQLYQRAHDLRFELFFVSLMAILFGSLVVPGDVYEEVVSPILLLVNVLMSLLLISSNKKLLLFFLALFTIQVVIFGFGSLVHPGDQPEAFRYAEIIVYFLFYVVVTTQIITQTWQAKEVDKNVIYGLMSGYISLGLVAFFIFLSIEIANPGSFTGLLMETSDFHVKIDSLIYYSYITLLTIGYGEIIPTTAVAQKAAVLVGLAGQFYLVIVTAVVIEKYLRARQTKE